MKKHILLYLFLGMILLSQAQPTHKNYTWEEKPEFSVVKLNEDEYEVITKDLSSVEFGFEEGGFYQYVLKHKIVYVGTEEGIERNNRIYVVADGFLETYFHKVRVISKSGEIRELSEDDIKEAQDESTGNTYRYFALEGVEEGSFVENLYLVKSFPNYNGKKETFQSEVRKQQVDFELLYPSHLIYTSKSYNGLPELEEDTTYTNEDVTRKFLHVDELEKLEEETNAANYANRQYLIYKLDANKSDGKKDMSSYGEASKMIYQSLYPEIDKGISKSLSKILGEIGVKKITDQEDQIRAIENYVKTHFVFVDAYAREYSELSSVLENKVGNKKGIVKLYAALFNQVEIKHEVVLTSDRMNLKFDPDFEAHNFLIDYLIYFPDLGIYMAPLDVGLRLGFMPFENAYNHGLFIKTLAIGDIKTGIGKIKFIDPLPFDKNYSNIDLDVSFTEGMLEAACNLKTEVGGYYAQGIQPYYELLTDDQKKEVVEEQMRYVSGDVELGEIEVEHGIADEFGLNPFTLKTTYTTSNYTEKAGNKTLFKIGLLIGQQMEMYNESERKQPVESGFNRIYNRKLVFNIPEGYNPTNLDDLNMNVVYAGEDGDAMAFKSTYKQNGNSVEVIIKEYYKQITVPLNDFAQYQEVINAAADFNKKVIVFEQK